MSLSRKVYWFCANMRKTLLVKFSQSDNIFCCLTNPLNFGLFLGVGWHYVCASISVFLLFQKVLKIIWCGCLVLFCCSLQVKQNLLWQNRSRFSRLQIDQVSWNTCILVSYFATLAQTVMSYCTYKTERQKQLMQISTNLTVHVYVKLTGVYLKKHCMQTGVSSPQDVFPMPQRVCGPNFKSFGWEKIMWGKLCVWCHKMYRPKFRQI